MNVVETTVQIHHPDASCRGQNDQSIRHTRVARKGEALSPVKSRVLGLRANWEAR